MPSDPLGAGYTDPTAAYYLDQIRKYITQQIGGKSASSANTPLYGVSITDSSTATDTASATSLGAPSTFKITGDKTNQKLWSLFDRDVLDGSDNAHTLTITGAETYGVGPLVSPGMYQKAFSFDGSSDLTSSTEADFDRERTDTFSISFWAKWTSASIVILVSKMTAVSNTGYEIGTTAAGKVRIRLINTITTNEVDLITPLAYNLGYWNHFCFTKAAGSNAAACKLYVNGTAITLTVTTDNLSATILNNIPLVIGAYDGGTGRLTGLMSDFQFWNVELSSTNANDLAKGRQISYDATNTQPIFSGFGSLAT